MESCFKAYDIRGKYPQDINEDIAYNIGCGYASFLRPQRVVVGRDNRLSSDGLCDALCRGLMHMGVDVLDIGLSGTEQIYFAVPFLEADGGIMVTASHNPSDYNGMKLVRDKSMPISGDTGLNEIKRLVFNKNFKMSSYSGEYKKININEVFIRELLKYIDKRELRPFRVVANAGNGCAGRIIDLIESYLPIDFIKIYNEPDGRFPNGVPNPILKENREITSRIVKETQADIGLAWDGDFDRCFFFDEYGYFVEGYYIVGLLAEDALSRHKAAKIILDPRLRWNTIEIVQRLGGTPIVSKTGHAFIKERMRAEDAVYGGEMSAHHYFKDFNYCDSGMLPWLIVLDIMNKSGKKLSELIADRQALFPISGEINIAVDRVESLMEKVRERYANESLSIDYIDGVSMEFKDWRFNLRTSNTEPLIRLNVESRGDKSLLDDKTSEIISLIEHHKRIA